MDTTGELVRRRREDLALTQTEAAMRAGVSVTTWSKIERDEGPFSARVRREVARVLDIPVDVFHVDEPLRVPIETETTRILQVAKNEVRSVIEQLRRLESKIDALDKRSRSADWDNWPARPDEDRSGARQHG